MRRRGGTLEDLADGEGSSSAKALIRGLDILSAFSANDATLGNQDLIRRTGLPKATVSRLTAVLTSLGYLHYDAETGRYSIGPATVSLGYSALSSSPVVHAALPLMETLAKRTGGAVALGARDGLDMVYLANHRSMGPVTLQLNVGSRLPIWRTAMGLAYIADLSAAEREAILDEIERAEPASHHAIRDLVDRSVKQYRRDGFVCAIGTWFSYINAVGTVFRPSDGTQRIAITCGGIVDILNEKTCREVVGPDVVDLITQLKLALSHESGTRADQ